MSPKQGNILELFHELVHFTRVFPHANLDLEAVMCDIKTVRTPFLTSFERFGIPTRRCVTLNVADVSRYPHHALVLFDVHFESMGVKGQWIAFTSDLMRREPKIHEYLNRKEDPVNRQRSYVLDLTWMKRCA